MIYSYLWLFVIFSFIGWCSEVVFAAIREKRFVNRGFLNGPFCPIYGFGVLIIDFLLKPFGHNMAALLIGSLLIGSGLEWLAGFLLEKLFGQKWWDYSDQPHNLNGYICLKFSILWSVAGALTVRFVVPLTEYFVSLMPKPLGYVLLTVLGAVLLSDFIVTVIAILGLNRKLKNLEMVSAQLKKSSDFIGKELYEGTMAAEGRKEERKAQWQKEALRLREKYEESLRTNKLHRRLLKAFPDLKSLKHNVQLEELRKNVNVFRKRSKALLQKHNDEAKLAYELKIPKGQEKPFAFGLCYSKLFWIFMIGNFVGFVLETIYALLMPPHQFELRVSVVFGPFILVYGFGAVVITLLLYKMYNQKDIMIFFASMVIGGAFEYFCSFFQQAMFGTVSWEYSDSALNIGGRTNLMYSFFWGVLGLIWVKDLYPIMSRFIQKIPKKVGRPITVAVTIFMVIDIALSAGAVYRRSERINNIPATNAVQKFFDTYFDDDFLDIIYPNMQYVGKPELPQKGPADDPLVEGLISSLEEGQEQQTESAASGETP